MTESNLTPAPVQLTALQMRQAEVDAYAQNIAMYKAIADALPSEWPAHLIQFRNSTNRHADIALIESLNDVELVSNLWAHDLAKASIRSEMVEKSKSEAILAFLKAQA
jgi:hypothetical protein